MCRPYMTIPWLCDRLPAHKCLRVVAFPVRFIKQAQRLAKPAHKKLQKLQHICIETTRWAWQQLTTHSAEGSAAGEVPRFSGQMPGVAPSGEWPQCGFCTHDLLAAANLFRSLNLYHTFTNFTTKSLERSWKILKYLERSWKHMIVQRCSKFISGTKNPKVHEKSAWTSSCLTRTSWNHFLWNIPGPPKKGP